jgi:hypothetical protein
MKGVHEGGPGKRKNITWSANYPEWVVRAIRSSPCAAEADMKPMHPALREMKPKGLNDASSAIGGDEEDCNG